MAPVNGADDGPDPDEQPVRRLSPLTTSRRWLRRGILALAATIMAIGLFAEGKTVVHDRRHHAAPVPLDGTYRIEEERSQQTFDNRPDPQPPDVTTSWAIRSSCTSGGCRAAAILLDDHGHTVMVFEFADGQWRSRPRTVRVPCAASETSANHQQATQVLSLRPRSHSELVGEMVTTVTGDECGRRGGVIRVPAAAHRSGNVPPGVDVPDPAASP